MNYLVILALVTALTIPPVSAVETPTVQAQPVQKGKLKLAKKKDHSKVEKPSKKSKK